MDEPTLRARAALWRLRAAHAFDPREGAACEEIAARYEQMADGLTERGTVEAAWPGE